MEKIPNFNEAEEIKTLAPIEIIKEEAARERIDPTEFEGLFTREEIEADMENCVRLSNIFKEDSLQAGPEQLAALERGEAAEYTFRHAIEDYGWLAEKISVTVASLYDDYVRGIDAIAEIPRGTKPSQHLGFAIDFASSADDVGNKLRRTFDSIDLGYTSSVKYFESESLGKQTNFKIPRVVVGAGPESLERLVSYSQEIMKDSSVSDEVKRQLREDAFQYVVLGEITAQLSVFCNRLEKVIAKSKAEKKPDITRRAEVSLEIHSEALQTMISIITEKGVDMGTIQKHVRGDAFAAKMGTALSQLSLTPITLEEQKKKTQKS
jgi:hypothetical protein